MNPDKANQFINKTIEKTHQNMLQWRTLSPSDFIKPLPDETLLGNAGSDIEKTFSYTAQFQSGEILLLAIKPDDQNNTLAVDDYVFSLRVQDVKSKYSVEISNTKFDSHNASLLLRLYNLIDKGSSTLNVLIDNFLDS